MDDNTTTSERRAHPRFRTELELHGTPESGDAVARMITSDLSMGGLSCVSSADFPEMTRLAVRLMLPLNGGIGEQRPVDLEAVVVRREPIRSISGGDPRFELALFFTNVEDGAKEHLARFLAN